MAIVVHGVVTLNRVAARSTTTRLGDGGLTDRTFTITGQTARRWETLAQAKLVEQQLHELVWYSRQAGGLHINSGEYDLDDGLYELLDVATSTDVATPVTYMVSCALTLRRVGGGGTVGPNVTRRVVGSAALQANSWSITSTPLLALPIGATGLDTIEATTRAGYDSATGMSLRPATSALYAFDGADYLKGEVRIWDTLGSGATTDWVRVWSPDHAFASPAHVVIDNTLLRIQSLGAGTNKASHTLEIWTGAAWVYVTDTTRGDGTTVGAGGLVTEAYAGVLIQEITPNRCVVAFQMYRATAPYYWTKTITLERGRYLALVALATTGSAAYVELGMTGSSNRFVLTRPASIALDNTSLRDHTTQAASVDLTNTGDNWIATFTGTSATAVGLGAIASTSDLVAKHANGGFAIYRASSTTLNTYLGGVPYAATTSVGEAEAQTLDGGATAVATIAGASGGGNNQVLMDAVNEGVTWNALGTYGPTGSRVRLWVRLAVSSTASATDNLIVIIRRLSDNASLATRNIKPNEFTAGSTWQWFSLEYAAWNGTDALRPVIGITVRGAATNWSCDLAVMLTLDVTSYHGIKPLANQALTEMWSWTQQLRAAG